MHIQTNYSCNAFFLIMRNKLYSIQADLDHIRMPKKIKIVMNFRGYESRATSWITENGKFISAIVVQYQQKCSNLKVFLDHDQRLGFSIYMA